uniref:Uncharacterized protein n=1 Tax=Physcomitrium patens TaxID=3218 RepID=A0A2K1KJM4_PHYPA|nr:hypothetical protein PHYPA_007652 [Physcomitrium patens]
MNGILQYLQETLRRHECLLSEEHIQIVICYYILAFPIAFNCLRTYKLSLQHKCSTCNIFLKQLIEDNLRTKDSTN